jgi:hypothetical protein
MVYYKFSSRKMEVKTMKYNIQVAKKLMKEMVGLVFECKSEVRK